MNHYNRHREMILIVAQALGQDLLDKTAFVGGCTTGLLITDPMTRENVRYTDDVDLIVSAPGYVGWHNFSQDLTRRGFRIDLNDEVNCRFRLGTLQVDFMPDDENVLGFSNRWYRDAINTATRYQLNHTTNIRLVTPPYFLATKLEAYKGRGRNDLLSSHDIEDFLNVIDGRAELTQELEQVAIDVRQYLSDEVARLLQSPDIPYAVQATAGGDSGREALIFQRLDRIAAPGQ